MSDGRTFLGSSSTEVENIVSGACPEGWAGLGVDWAKCSLVTRSFGTLEGRWNMIPVVEIHDQWTKMMTRL